MRAVIHVKESAIPAQLYFLEYVGQGERKGKKAEKKEKEVLT
jgi:hypothetical protein